MRPDGGWSLYKKITSVGLISRQNSDHRGAVPDENLGAGARGDVRPAGAHLHLHDLLLLHEEMADAPQDDALKGDGTFTPRSNAIAKANKADDRAKSARVTDIHMYTRTRIHTDTHIYIQYTRIHPHAIHTRTPTHTHSYMVSYRKIHT